MKKNRTSGMNIWRAYAAAMLLCLCVTALVCGIVTADVNTRTVVMGDDGAVAAGSQNENSITLSVNDKIFSMDIKNNLRKASRLIPAPLGNIIALPECLAELIESYM